MSALPGPELLARLAPLRPRLHRYCARMVGSSLDAEDLVQEAYVKALLADAARDAIDHADAWMFRVVHNLALDHLRRRALRSIEQGCDDVDVYADPHDEIARRQAGSAALAVFMRLPPVQRTAVILVDVLEHGADEAATLLDTTTEALKSALQRGRANLRRHAAEPGGAPPAGPEPAALRQRLRHYADRFNAGDFAGLQALLRDDVEIDLVNRVRIRGAATREYFHRYAAADPWIASVGSVDGRPAVLLRRPGDPADRVGSFLLPSFRDDGIDAIRDYLYAPHVLGDALVRFDDEPPAETGR
jgi:RNA polymerase sigma-70 factor (ECF subfamily)